jgi:tetratricopeptide (TPR) repeat protein
MHVRFLALACVAFALLSSPSQAQVIVLGNGAANACWRGAEFGSNNLNYAFQECSRALAQPQISLYNRAATYVNRSVLRMRAGDNSGALADADAATNLMANMGEAHVNRGAALLNLMRPDQALEAINIGLERGTKRLHLVYYNRGSAKYLLGDIEGAYYDYKMSTEINPEFALAQEALSHFEVITSPAADGSEGTEEVIQEIVALSSPVNLN